jgi:predicted DNA-binding antitoxin AbrB/MazE fold protein
MGIRRRDLMTTAEAVYENGVLRLLEPLALEEGTPVDVIVLERRPDSRLRTPAEILAKIAALPESGSGESFPARDHDRILYGEQRAP